MTVLERIGASGRLTYSIRDAHRPEPIFVSVGKTIRRLGGGVVARSTAAIGPARDGRDGALYYASDAGVFRVGNGRAWCARQDPLAPRGLADVRRTAAPFCVSDGREGDRIVRSRTRRHRVDVRGDQESSWDRRRLGRHRLRRRSTSRDASHTSRLDGRSLGYRGPALPGDPYDVQVTRNGSLLVLEAGQVGARIRVIDARGHVSMLSRH